MSELSHRYSTIPGKYNFNVENKNFNIIASLGLEILISETKPVQSLFLAMTLMLPWNTLSLCLSLVHRILIKLSEIFPICYERCLRKD